MPAGVIAEWRRDPLCHLVAQRAHRIVGAVDVTARHRQVSDAASGRLNITRSQSISLLPRKIAASPPCTSMSIRSTESTSPNIVVRDNPGTVSTVASGQ